MANKQPSRIEDEVREILAGIDDLDDPPRKRFSRGNPDDAPIPIRSKPRHSISHKLTGTPWMFPALAIMLILFAFAFRGASSNLSLYLTLGAVAMFLAPFIFARRNAGGQVGEIKQWRGRDVILEPDRDETPGDKLVDWFRKRRR